jgi:GDP-L-fucose synthase
MVPGSRIFIAGHHGLVGSALVRRWRAAGCDDLMLKSRSELDLCNQAAVDAAFAVEKPDVVLLAAARVGGIHANSSYPAEFLHQNLVMQSNVIDAAWRHGVRKLLFLGSSCIYPKLAPQPMNEDCLLTGPLEPTNEWYAIAKIAGLKMCQAYRRQYRFNAIAVMPTNLYGPGDNFDLQNSHVLPALIRKFHEAKESGAHSVEIWGSGTPRREFLHVDDLADACFYLMQHHDSEQLINVGWRHDVTIAELAALVAKTVGYTGALRYDASKPDGTPRKLLDTARLTALGWHPRITLEQGLADTYRWYQQHGSGRA